MLRRGGQGVLGAEKGRLGGTGSEKGGLAGHCVQEGEAGEGAWCRKGRLEGALDLPPGAKKGRLVVALDAEKGRLMGRWVQGHRAPSTRSCLALAQGRLLTGALKNNFLSINVNKSLDLSSK